MRFSVVINTYNRAHSLENTLRGLKRQTHDDFEVIVVNGPSTDHTTDLLHRWRADIRTATCEHVHLGKSRNIGIEAAAGELVAFIDDDAVPEPDWLEGLEDGFDHEGVGGVGGLVFDHTGMQLQYRYAACSRTGRPTFDVLPPFDDYVKPGADPFLYLQGTNNSLRRSALEEIGGFDEEIEYYLDETEVCLQLIDHGYEIRTLDGAAVHHRYLASHLRTERGVWTAVYPQVKNRYYFALRYGRTTRTEDEVRHELEGWVDEVARGARESGANGSLSEAQVRELLDQIERARRDGTERALSGTRQSRVLAAADPAAFRALTPIRSPGPPLRVCFVAEEYPPGPVGGIGRFTSDLAEALAEHGHEIHVVTQSPDVSRVDIENDVWVHRIAVPTRRIRGIERSPLAGNLRHQFAMYHEVRRLHERRPLSLVSAPIWNAEAFPFALDGSLPAITSLHTTLRTVTDVLPSLLDNPHIVAMLGLEAATLRASTDFHANSEAVIESIRSSVPDVTATTHLVPHGLRDPATDGPAEPLATGGRTRILFVGRLERRKGVDTLLTAFSELAREHDVELVLVGKDTPNTELGMTYREWFAAGAGADSRVASRVQFVGEVDDAERDRYYRSADIFCAPSRYESFGLVLLEAMAFGLPLVSCNAGGIPEVVDGNGVLVEPDDPAALRDGLWRLMAGPALRREMGERSRDIYERAFSSRPWAQRVEAAYATVAQSARNDHEGIEPARLAAVLLDLGAADSAAAAAVAARDLLDPEAYAVDCVAELGQLLVAPDEVFVRGAYRLVLGREADADGLASALAHLRIGGSRLDIIGRMAVSDEGRDSGANLPWTTLVLPHWSSALATAVADLATVPSRRFVDELYRLILQRPPDRRGRLRALASLELGLPRHAMVRAMAKSYEAQHKGVPSDWIESLPADDAPSSSQRLARTLRAGRVVKAVSPLRQRAQWLRDTVRETSQLLDVSRETSDRLERNARVLRELRADIADLTRQLDVLGSHMSRDQRGHTEYLGRWLDVLARKSEGLALDLRERVPPRPDSDDLIDPIVVKPAALESKREAGEPLRINVGCGEKPLPGYINVDGRALPDVDIVADIRKLPFGPGELDEIASAHLVEHFRRRQLEQVILPYWHSLLKPGGVLRVTCPNLEAMVLYTAKGDFTLDEFAQVAYGLQEYEGDDHFAGYSPDTFEQLLTSVGFVGFEVIDAERRNGLCFEMEVIAHKPEESITE